MTDPNKLITLVRAGEDWIAGAAARLASGLPGARRIVINRVRPVEVRAGGVERGWDAVVEGWFDSRAAAEAARPAFAEGAETAVPLLVREELIHDSGIRPLPSKILVTFRRRPSLSRAAAQAHWRGRHVEVGLVENNAADFLRLYFQNHVVDDNAVDLPAYDYDGLPEFWLDEDALASVGADSPVMKAIAADEENFIDRSSIVTMLVEELPVFQAR